MNEREFLAAELQRAQAALRTTTDEARRHALDLADPGYWGRNYPWQTVGVSAAAGFLIGAALAPQKTGTSTGVDPNAGTSLPRAARAKIRRAGWAKPALTAALEVGRFVFQNVLLTGWQAAQAPPELEPEPAMAGYDS
jgi:hypothetical protein